MEMLNLIPTNETEISIINELAQTIWWQHYPAIISETQISYMLNKMYSQESLLQQIREKKHQFYFIENNNERIGFISVHEESPKAWFINKFYINQTKAAKGIGTKAFRQLLTHIRPKTIRLTVNRQNYKSVNFYFKNGFIIEKVADFDIGNGYVMNDFVMFWDKR
jgi:diamine N-acetyltransferase